MNGLMNALTNALTMTKTTMMVMKFILRQKLQTPLSLFFYGVSLAPTLVNSPGGHPSPSLLAGAGIAALRVSIALFRLL